MKKKQTENSAKRASSIIRGRLAQKIAALCLAGAMTFPLALSLGACGGNGTGNTTNPNGNQTQHGTTNYSQYSKLLQDVLTSEHYNFLIEQGKYAFGYRWDDFNIKEYPYAFLEKQGHDVDKIRSGELECTSDAYIIGNDTNTLRLATHVENENPNGNYYTHYILEYKLSDKEYEDLYMLFDGEYIQAPLFIQEIANSKTAKIISAYNFDKSLVNKMSKYVYIGLKDQFVTAFDQIPYDLVDVRDANHITIAVRDAINNKNDQIILKDRKIKYLDLFFSNISSSTYYDGIFRAKSVDFLTENEEKFYNESTQITYFAIAVNYRFKRNLIK